MEENNMKYQNKILTVIILIILFVGCASSKRRMDSDSREKDDSLEFLIDYADLSKVRNNDFSETEIESFSYRFDKLCDDDIFVTKNHTIERLQKKTEKIFDLIDVFETNNKIVNNISYSISSNELIFKVLVATQERLKEAYQYNENHAGYTFDVKIAMTLPYIQTNQMCSDLKSKLLLNTINLLPEISTNIEKERCWLAIDRMIEKIDIKKSESGYDPFQRGPEGIYTSNGEILSLLNAYHEREVDNSIIEYSGEILNKIIERLDRKLDKQFWHNVRSSRTMNREFQNQRARLADEKQSVAIDSSNAKTADEWFFLGYYAEQSDLKLNYYSKALELDPEHAAAYNNRGNILRSLGKNEKAIEDLSLAIALDPLYAPAYINRGTMYRDVHEYSKAIRDYDKALELDSSFTIIFYNRAACHKSLGLY